MQSNSDMTRTQNPRFTSPHVRVHLNTVLIGNGSPKRTIYCYILDIIFTCSTYCRAMLLFLFVCHIIAFDLYVLAFKIPTSHRSHY